MTGLSFVSQYYERGVTCGNMLGCMVGFGQDFYVWAWGLCVHVGAKQESLGVYASSLGITGKYLVKTVERKATQKATRGE